MNMLIVVTLLFLVFMLGSLVHSFVSRKDEDSQYRSRRGEERRSGVYVSDGVYTHRLPDRGSPQHVQEICAQSLIHAMNTASERCLSSNSSAYDAYRAGESWIRYHERYSKYMQLYQPFTFNFVKSSSSQIQSRMSQIRVSYEAEKAAIDQARFNLKSYMTNNPNGYRKKAISFFATRSKDSQKYYRYFSAYQDFKHAGLIEERSVDGSVRYVYIGGAVKQILLAMDAAPSVHQKEIFKRFCPKRDSDERKVYAAALRFMRNTGMIDMGKDEKGFVTYSLQSSIPRIVPCSAAERDNALLKIRSQDEYAINKALFFVNAPSYLEREKLIADFTSLTQDAIYHTSLCSCSCPAFEGSHAPCKHMIRLAVELGIIYPDHMALRFTFRPELGYLSDPLADFY